MVSTSLLQNILRHLIQFNVLFFTADSNVTIVPETQYVYLNHNATFECATNLTGYTLTFSYGGSITVTLKETNLPDGGIKVTTTFIVTNSLNGTSVRCHADDDMNPLISTSKVYVYTQGLYILGYMLTLLIQTRSSWSSL